MSHHLYTCNASTVVAITGKTATPEGKQAAVKVSFTAKKTGKTSKYSYVSKVTVNSTTPVDETTKIASAKQKTFTEFTVTMSKALETVAAADFSMVRDDDNQVITVKSATLDATDKTQVKLVVYTSLTDAKTYTITYTAADEAKTQSSTKVTVTDGTVADVAITPLEITANQETLIEYQTLDANGVIVSQKKVSAPETKVEVSCNTLLGTLDNATSKLILYNIGDTATFTVTYHTYKYDSTTGAEQDVIKKDFTVNAVKDATVVSQYRYTVATEKPYDWSKVTPVSTVALGDGDSDGISATRYAFFQIKNQKGDDITATCGYTVESSDNSKVVADGEVKTGVTLSPVAAGSAYLMIKDTDGKVVSTLPITVGEKRKLSVFKLDKNSVSIATNAAVNSVASVYVEATAKDQYGEDMAVTLTDKQRTNYTGISVAENSSKKLISITSNNATDNKTSVYTITATDGRNNEMTTTLNVTAKAPKAGGYTYSVVFMDAASKVVSSVDTTVKEAQGDNSAGTSTVNSYVVRKNNGVVIDALSSVDCESVKVTRNGDNKVFFNATKGAAAKVTSAAIAVDTADTYTGTAVTNQLPIDVIGGSNASNSGLKKNLAVGNYTVQYEIKVGNMTYKPYATLAVTDKQTAVTARVLDTNAGNNAFNAIVNNPDFVRFYYGDVELPTSDYAYVEADYTINNNGKNAFVKTVTLNVKAASSNNYFQVTIPVNKTFTSDNTWTSSQF